MHLLTTLVAALALLSQSAHGQVLIDDTMEGYSTATATSVFPGAASPNPPGWQSIVFSGAGTVDATAGIGTANGKTGRAAIMNTNFSTAGSQYAGAILNSHAYTVAATTANSLSDISFSVDLRGSQAASATVIFLSYSIGSGGFSQLTGSMAKTFTLSAANTYQTFAGDLGQNGWAPDASKLAGAPLVLNAARYGWQVIYNAQGSGGWGFDAGNVLDIDNVKLTAGQSTNTYLPLTYDGNGFFHLNSGHGPYVGYKPNTYSHSTPISLFVWMHGCGGNPEGDMWTIAPPATRQTQSYIAISLGGREGGGNGTCWNTNVDGAKVLAAITDIARYFHINPRKIYLGGYSSGGNLTYRVGLENASLFAGLLAVNSDPFTHTGRTGTQLMASASWKINVAHLAHVSDNTFPIASVRTNMATLVANAFPATLIEKPGTHYDADVGSTGTNYNIRNSLLPYLDAGWQSPSAGTPDIAIKAPNGSLLASGGSHDLGTTVVGVPQSVTFTIANTGNAALTGLTIDKSGTNAADFTVTTSPVAPLQAASETTFMIEMSAATAGVKSATLSIASNDPDENPYIIHLTGRVNSSMQDADTRLLVQPYWEQNKLRMYAGALPQSPASQVHEINLAPDVQAAWGSTQTGPNAVVCHGSKMFVSFDIQFSHGGVFVYNKDDVYPVRNGNAPTVLKPGGGNGLVCFGMAVQPTTGDLYVATYFGGVRRFTAASGYSPASETVHVGYAAIGGAVKGVTANLAFDRDGNLWFTTWDGNSDAAADHLLICLKDNNPATAYTLRGDSNNGAPAYTATIRSGGTKAVHLFSGPEGITFDSTGNLWFGNNNDNTFFQMPNDPGDGTFCKISHLWIDILLRVEPPGNYLVPPNQTEVNLINGSQFGGVTWFGGAVGLLIHDQHMNEDPANAHVWRFQTGVPFNAQNCFTSGIYTTHPGNGSMAIFSGSNEPPVITAAMLSHSGLAFSDEVLSVTSTTASDPENAALIFSYQWQFSYNGVSFTTDATVTTAMLSVGLSRDHKLWRCVIRASDGINVSQPFTTQTVNLLPRPPMNVFTGYPYLYSCGLVLRNGELDAPALFRLGVGSNLPAGLLFSDSGAISGTVSPSAAVGAYLITIERYNSFGETVSQTFTLNVQSETPQTLDFRQTDLDGGGWLNGFASHSGGRLYARTDVGGVYRSDDRGDSWKFLTGEATSIAPMHVQGLAVGETSADLVFHTAGSSYTADDAARGVWRSADGGATWSHVLANVNFSGNADISGLHDRSGDDNLRWQGECLAITPGSNDQEIFTITRKNGLWRSTTGGGEGTWTKQGGTLFDGLVGHVVHLHSAFPNEIFVGGVKDGSTHALYKGTRGGGGAITWATVTVNAATTSVSRLARLPSGVMFAAVQNGLSDFFYKSDATGTTWTNITATVLGGFTSNGSVGMCHVLKDNTTIVLSWIGGPTRKSTDGGTTWTSIPLSITGTRPAAMLSGETSPSWSRGALHQDPLDPNRWYIPNGFGPFRSTDAGATIQYMTKGIGEVVTWKPAWHPNDPQRVYMPMADLIGFVATDGSATGGAQRNPRNSLPLNNGNVGMTYSSKTLVGPVVGNASPKVYFIGGASFGNNGGRSCILTTTDDGQTWSLVHVSGITGTGLPATSAIVSGCVAPDDPNEILVSIGGGASGIYRSTNGGVTFTQSTGVPAVGNWGDQFSHFSFLEADTAVPTRRFAWLNGVGFLISNDRGVTWASSGHSVGGPTDNKLLSWNKWGFLARDHATGRLWFGGTAGHLGLAYSTNNGANWTYLNAPNSNTGFSEVRAIDAHNSQVLVCGKRFGDAFLKMYYSDDNGATWTERSKPGYRFPTTTEVALNPHARGQFWIASNGRSYARYALGDAITPEPFVAWQQAQFTPAMLANPAVSGQDADPDGDGQDNAFEFAAGLSPLDPQSRFVQVIENLPPQIGEPQIMSLQFAPLVAGRTYVVECSSSLGAAAEWKTRNVLSTNDNGIFRTIRIESDPMKEKEFFRLLIEKP